MAVDNLQGRAPIEVQQKAAYQVPDSSVTILAPQAPTVREPTGRRSHRLNAGLLAPLILIGAGALPACSGTASGNNSAGAPETSSSAAPFSPLPDSGTPSMGPTAPTTEPTSPSVRTTNAPSIDQVIDNTSIYFKPRTYIEFGAISPDQAGTVGADHPVTIYFRQADGTQGKVRGDIGILVSTDKTLPKDQLPKLPFVISETETDGTTIDQTSIEPAASVDSNLRNKKDFGMLGQIVQITGTDPAKVMPTLTGPGNPKGLMVDAIEIQA